MKRKREIESRSMYSALLTDYADAKYGSQSAFAQKLGVRVSTVTRWVRRTNKPSSKAMELLPTELNIPPEGLTLLSKISVREACELILEHAPSRELPLECPPVVSEPDTRERWPA